VLGPTGGGKSGFVNALFNIKVAPTSGATTSNTRTVNIYEGSRIFDDGAFQIVHVFDCLGFCDSALSEHQVLAVIKEKITLNTIWIDTVVIITHGRLELKQREDIQAALNWLQFNKHVGNFVFLHNKADELTPAERVESISDIQASFQVTPLVYQFPQDEFVVSNIQTTIFSNRREPHAESLKGARDAIFRRAYGGQPHNRIKLEASSCAIL